MSDVQNLATLGAAAAAFFVSVARWLTDHVRDRREQQQAGPPIAEQVSQQLAHIGGKLDDAVSLFEKRLTTLEVVTGLEGGNGLRAASRDHEERLRDLERVKAA